MSGKDIKKGRQSEKELKEIEEKYRILFEKSPASITLLDRSGIVLDCNESTEQLTGYSRDEIIGRDFSQLATIDFKDLSRMKEIHKQHQKGKEAEPFELEIIRKDGERRWIDIISSIQMKNDEVVGIQIISNDITEQKRARSMLQESEEKYSNLFNKSNDAIFIHDLEGNIIDVNPRVEDYLGYSLDNVMKLKIHDLHPPDVLEKSREAFETISQKGFVNFEIDFQKKNGDIFPAEVSSSLFEIGGQSVIQGIVRDITERRKTEEVIREGENKWRSLIENTSDFILIVDRDGTITFINRTLPDIKIKDVIGKKIYDFQQPESQEIHRKMLEKVFQTGDSETFQATSTGPESSLAWYETKMVPIKEDQQVLSVLLLGADITERKKAEMALKESEEKYRHIVENSNDVIMLTQPDGIISYMSPACERVLGYAPEDLIGKQPWPFHPNDLEKVKEVHFQALQGRSGTNFEYRVVTKSGKIRWVSHSWSPIMEENKLQMIVSVVRDITERKKALEESRILSSVVEQSISSTIIMDKSGVVEYANPKFLEAYDWRIEDVVGRNWRDFIPVSASIREMLTDIQEKVMEQGKVWAEELSVESPTGKEIWRKAMIFPLKDGRDEITNIVYISEDITKQKEAEEALRESEEKFRLFFENGPDYCYMISPAGTILDVNIAALKAMGYAKEEMVGKPIGFIYAPQTIQKMEDLFNIWKKTGSLKNEEMTVLTKNGKTLTVLLSADAVRRKDDEILYSVSVQRDITERKIMEEVINKSEVKYRSLIEKAGAGIAVSDLEGLLTYVNEALCKMIGFSEEELIGKPFIDFIHPDDMENILTIFEAAFDDPHKEVQLEFRIIHKDGHDVYLYTRPTVMIYDDKIAGFNAIITDITERKIAEKAIARRNEELSVLNMIAGATNQSLELDKVLNFALEETMSVLGVGGGLITLFDDKTQTFVPAIWEGFSEEIIKEEAGFKIGEGISGQTVQLGIPLLVPDLNSDKSDVSPITVKEGWQSLVSVPLKSKDEIIGVMTVSSKEKERFKPEDMEIIGAIGNQIGMAIQNAHLYEESQKEITERMKVEGALRKSEEKYRNIIEQSSEGLILLDENGYIIEWNKAQEIITGLQRDEVIQKPFWDILYRMWPQEEKSPERKEQIKNMMKEASILRDAPWMNDMAERRIQHTDGSIRIIESTIFPIILSKGLLFASINRDITKRVQAEETIKEGEEKLRSILESSPDAITVTDLSGKIIECNPATVNLHGFSDKSEVLGKNSFDFIAPEEQERAYENLEKILRDEYLRNIEYTMLKKDGSRFQCELSASPILNPEGKPSAFVGITKDITDRKLAEEAIRDSQAELSKIFNNIPILVLLVDKERRVRRINSVGSDLTGRSEKEMIGLRGGEALRCIHSLDDPKGCGFGPVCKECVVRKTVLDTFEENKQHHQIDANITLIQGDHQKELSLLVSTTPVIVKGDEMVLVCLEDITERKQAEESLRESEVKYRDLVENIDEVIYAIDKKGTVTYVSPSIEPLIGYNLSDVLNLNFKDFVYEDDLQRVMKGVQSVFLGQITDNVYRIVAKSGEIRWIHTSSKPIYEGDSIIGLQGILSDITEQKQAEEALMKSEERFRDLAQLLPEGVFEIDLEGKFTFANQKAFEISGYSQEDMDKGMNAFQMFIPEDQDRLKENIGLILSGRDLGVNEYTAVRKDGTQYPVLIHSAPILLDDNPVGLRGIIIDITEKKRAEQALKESEERFRSIVQSSPMGMHMYQIEQDGSLVFAGANPAADNILGVMNEQFIGKTIEEAFPPLIETEVPERYRLAASKGEPWFTEQVTYEDKHISGAYEVHAFQTSPRKMTAMFLDITDRKKAQEAIIEREEKYRTLFEKSPMSITLADKSGVIIDCNKLTEEITGYKKEEILGKQFDELATIDPRDYPMLKEKFTRLSKGQEDKPYEFEITRKDGERRWIIVLNSPLMKDDDVTGFQIIARDVTDRKYMEEALRESTNQWQTTFDTIKAPICIQNTERKILQCNKATMDQVAKPAKYILDHDCCKLMHGVDEPIDECPFTRAKKSLQRESLVEEIGDRWFQVTVDPIIDTHGAFTGAVHIMEDITESKKGEEQLKQSLEEREILFRELKHRVKNNLQLLSSMVGMQIMRMDSDIALKKFEEIQSVIDTIALIYSRAYEDTGIKGLNLNNFIEELVSGLLRFKAEEDMKIEHSIEGDNIQLSTDQAIPLALIANELVFNALKHAFIGKKKGHISISLKENNDTITLSISDNGIGIPKDMDISKTETLGLKLVQNLTKQLKGEMDMQIEKGTKFIIEVPKEEVD